MKIVYGTTNQAKLDSMKRIAEPLGIQIIGLKDLEHPIPVVNEDGKNPLENARIKAEAYYKAFNVPVFSCDSGLYFDDVEEVLQPETHIRRVNGKELTDDEMIAYYAGLAAKYNNRLVGRYRNAICFIFDEKTSFSSMDESLATEPFILVSQAHEKRVKGFPLDSLSIDVASGMYYYDIEEKTVDKSAIEQGFKEFWEKVLREIEES